ncbi:diguanylate cyclase (GGDEF)-like protein [Herbaspirillum sp. Sphag1AN]|uniref:sensor domain-containing diguanylate cyclase n=1 Tax=unclassified Herbaspirillum TaxID=2624150 RepID=UPI00161EF19D|nr:MULTISPECIES: sensor domain-containing diguanylate cyclase [unclassified Herbaspirillum]MBB3211822.1 diguanylate cyclase (GGDEF)-like protein [Herbaspirillum sp. Sphag1AN]MBB3244344.1 diguanylate cyclase (GGDEF)-like protein [Herbaspirillum sp. Sphag64]
MEAITNKNQAHGPGIRTSLAGLVVGCILPIALIAALLIFNLYERQQDQLIIDTMNRVKSISSAVDRHIAVTQSALLALSNAGSLDRGDFDDFQDQARETATSLGLSNILLADLQGRLLMSTLIPLGKALPEVERSSPPGRILGSDKPEVSDLFWGPILGRYVYAVTVPVKRKGQVRYSIAAAIPNDPLLSILNDQRLPASWSVIVSDSAGNLVANWHTRGMKLGDKVLPKLIPKLSSATEQVFEAKLHDGFPVLVIYSRSLATNWVVSVNLPLSEVRGNRHALSSVVFYSLLALSLGLLLAWLIGDKIANSITALIAPARALGSRLTVKVPVLFFSEANALREALLEADVMLQSAQYKASHDALTGLANRSRFGADVGHQLLVCERQKSSVAVLYIDLDGFKAVNDTFGHGVGDLLLKEVSARIKASVRQSDFTARLGGDEFAVALIDSNIDQASACARSLLEVLSQPYRFGEIEAHISASIGIAAYPRSGTDLQSLLKNADRAMYDAKKAGKRRICIAAT